MSAHSYDPTFTVDTPPDENAAKDPATADLWSMAELKDSHREARDHFLKHKEQTEAEEAAVYGYQWEEDEVTELAETGRLPLTFNHIQKTVLSMYGYRAENRFELQYVPIEASDGEEGEMLTQAAKHFWNACLAEFELARASLEQYIGGEGWAYCGLERDDPSRERFKLEFVPRKEMRRDPKSIRFDQLDADYQHRERWVRAKKLAARFPEHAKAIHAYASAAQREELEQDEVLRDHGGDPYSDANTTPVAYATKRKEIRVVETWYRVAKWGHYVKTPTGWEPFDAHSAEHQFHALLGGPKVIRPGTVWCVYFCTWFGGGKLEEGKTPYSHPYFPHVLIPGLRDQKGLPHGVVRAEMDIQKVINWTMSKLLWEAMADQWLIPVGAVDDLEKFGKDAGRPDAMLEYNADAGVPAPQRVDRSKSIAVNQEMLNRALVFMKEIGGSPDEMRGQESNADSAKGMMVRMEAGIRQQGLFLDLERYATQQIGLMWKSMIFDFVDDEQIIRIAQPNGQQASAVVNVTDPLRRSQLEAQGYKVFGTLKRINYDTKVIVSPLSTTIRKENANQMDQVAKNLPPEMFAAIADLWILSKDIPKKELIAERIAAFLTTPAVPPGGAVAPPLPGPAGMPVPEGMPVDPDGPLPPPLPPDQLALAAA